MTMLTGQEIKEIREALGFTPTEFAAKLGVSAAAVSRWEAGGRHPRWDTMMKINEMKDGLAKGKKLQRA